MTDQLPQQSLTPPIPVNETERLLALHRYKILDTPPEAAFDRITSLAARLFKMPIALISLVDESRAWFKSCIGFNAREVPRDATLCSFAVLTDEPLIIPDTRLDERFVCNPFVQSEPGVRFYAGAPLLSHDGFNLGTLCLLDSGPHEPLTAEQQATLVDLAAMVVDELELRLAAQKIAQVDAALLEITQGVSTVTGGAFFDALVQHFAKVLETDYVYIGLIEGDDPKQLRTIATLAQGKIVDNLTYPLQDTPCWEVIGQRKICCYPRNVQAHFPNAPLLKPLSVESYIAAPFFDSNGKPLGILGVMDGKPLENVNLAESLLAIFASRVATELERQQVEDALRESEERYRAFVAHSNEGIWRFELEEPLLITIDEHSQIEHIYKYGYLAECNLVMAQMYGFSEIDEIIGVRLGEFLPSSDSRNLDYLRSFIRSGYRLSDAESYEVDRFGNAKYFANNLVGIIQDGYLIRAWGNQRDISERKLTEDQLRESERFLKGINETAPNLLYIYDLNERRNLYVSPQIFPMLGVLSEDVQEVGSQLFAELFHPDDLEQIVQHHDRIRAAREDEIFTIEYRMKHSNGEWRWLTSRDLIFARDEQGKPVQILGSAIDITERKQAENALRESEAQFRLLANTVPQLIWTAKADGGVDYLNERWLEYTGISPQAFYEWGGQQIIHPDDLPHTLEVWTAVLQTGEPFEIKHRFRHVTGEWRWQLVRGIPYLHETGQIVKWFGTCTDIHESMMREQDAKFLSDIGEAIRTSDNPDELMTTTAEMIGQYLQVKRCCFAEIDEAHERWWVNSDYHSSLSSMVGEYRVSDDPPVVVESLRSGHLYICDDIEIDPRTVDYYATAYAPLGIRAEIVVPFYSDGRWTVSLLIATDQPRQWQAREINLLETAAERVWLAVEKLRSDIALHDSEERYRALIELSPQLVFMSRPDGYITYCNQWGLEFTGRSLAELQGDGWTKFIHPDHRERVYNVWQTATREISDYDIEIPYRRADGVYRWLYTRALPVTNETGAIVYWLGVALDISDRQQAELQLQQQASELRQLNVALEQTASKLSERNQELDRFVYTVSHDLKAPLRAIYNLSSWIADDLEGQLDEENLHQMQLLQNRVIRMEALINGLLSYSRIGRTEIVTERVKVGELVSEILDSLTIPPTFTIFVQPEMPTLLTERLLLSQVFSNLISNAIKYNDRLDGRIEIRSKPKGEYYEFTVTDNGPGIAPENHERVFEIFQTLKGQENPESTGIGLSIVKKIIETEGGSIVLESNLGEGATFRFTWRDRHEDQKTSK
ncbi:hypothetical protein C7H19_22520 [Aphanothece hegewaldii CCALA 016]|uniref:histidine kinase n=1 Tax=Aphanothece hegewaldii CCALA 016 TaxID=2107694 RepID=A0A2T1LRY6_9CHRO|nr:PAS domain S-box protein [Aphanothece hegewaldii]PSF31425.1 hypothetical protein C7H19_22520 [Aphanothece hegewaldii CCALA 016]